jgi:phage tail-like protein
VPGQTRQEADPAIGYCFTVEIDNKQIGPFTKIEGLAAEYEVFEYQEGGENFYTHRLPGRLKFQPIKLTKPVYATASGPTSSNVGKWFQDVVMGPLKQFTTARITAYQGSPASNKVIAKWEIYGVYPLKWTGPNFDVGANSVVTETLELAHNGFLPIP